MSANAGRPDLDATLKIPTLVPGEPVFILRGKDALAAATVRAWAVLAKQNGVPVAVVEQALRQADAMEAWEPKGLPDADHLGAEEQKQLAYQHSRRAWRAQDGVAGTELILAEQRGYDAAMAKVRQQTVAGE